MVKTREELKSLIPIYNYATSPRVPFKDLGLFCWQVGDDSNIYSFFLGNGVDWNILTDNEAISYYNTLKFNDKFIETI